MDRRPFRPLARKLTLDQPPSGRIIAIPFRQCPDRVEVIGQQNKCIYMKRMLRKHLAKCLAQDRNRILTGEDVLPIKGHHCEEERPARGKNTPVLHAFIIA